ncbi:MAG: aspartate/glutamate racemase family protein [Phototrophicaceae bacterium]
MRTIGLIGGMSWESSLTYYRLINEGVKARLGGFHSARSVMVSVDFAIIEDYQRAGDWASAADHLAEAARSLARAGADCVVLCTNTMHKVADVIEAAVNLPLIHIADPTAQAVKAAGVHTVGLLGTRFTMDEPFYRDRLAQIHGLDVLVPETAGRALVDRVIFDELVHGDIRAESRALYVDEINALARQGAQGIILGCTEIGLLIKPEHSPLPVFDTTDLHARAAVEFALAV